MKIPKINIQFHYSEPKTINIRYGIGWDGVYFFEVVNLVQHGCGYHFTSYDLVNKKWVKFCENLNELPVDKRLKLVKRVINKLEKKISEISNANLGNTYKFKTSTLFRQL